MSTTQNGEIVRGRGRPRDEDARQRILSASLELLEEAGFPQVTAEAIAERAGVSKATVYRWWPNKAAVVIEAFRQAFEPELPFPDSGSFHDDLQTQIRHFARVLSGRGGRMLVAFVVAARNDPEVAQAFRSIWGEPRRAQAREVLKRRQQRGQLRAGVDLDLVLDVLYGPLYYRLVVKNEPPSQKYAEALVELALQGLTEDHAPTTRQPLA